MTKKEVEWLYAYILNNHTRLQSDVRAYQSQVRYRECDVVDGLELSLAIERYNMFCVVTHDIIRILNLQTCDFEDVPDPRKQKKEF